MYFIIILIFIAGTIYGSFLNVIIFRLPINLSIIHPRSFCPNCSTNIPFYRNVPIISFIIQKGKCHSCDCKISFQYPIIELFIGILSLVSFHYLSYPDFIFYSIISGLLICISIIDYKFFIIPFSLLITSIIICIPFIVFFSNTIYHIYGMIIGIGYLSFIFIITWLVTKKQPLGFGDLQLMILLGLWLGPLKTLITIFLAAIIGISYWIIISFIRGYSRNLKLPFGTFLSITAIIIYLIPLNWDLFN